MPRSVVCVGIPVDIEEREYELKNGKRAGQMQKEISFHLHNPLTAALGSTLFYTKSDAVMESVMDAFNVGVQVNIVATPTVVRSDQEDDYGRPRDWVKLQALAVS